MASNCDCKSKQIPLPQEISQQPWQCILFAANQPQSAAKETFLGTKRTN